MRIRCRSALIIADPGTRVSTKGRPLRTSSDVFPLVMLSSLAAGQKSGRLQEFVQIQ